MQSAGVQVQNLVLRALGTSGYSVEGRSVGRKRDELQSSPSTHLEVCIRD
jgi:hypothetical protein